MAAPLANLVLRSAVWLGALVWWVSLRKPANMSWAGIPFGVVTVLGLVIMGAGMAIFIWTARTLAGAVPNAIDAPAVLLLRGPFRFVRNPLYLAAAAVFVGVTTVYRLWQPRDAFVVSAIALLIHLFVVYREEPVTRRRFGPAYDAYRAHVPRWIPRGRAPHSVL